MRADNSRHLIAAARHRRQQTLTRARQALQDLIDNGQQISIAAVAARASVSRAWLYAETELRQQIQAAASNPHKASPGSSHGAQPASDASLRQRLALAHERIRQLTEDNQRLRDQIARLHGQLRLTKLTPVTDTIHDTNQQATPTTRSFSPR
jgi:hypothetical protein